jgi:hypothetical protein
MIISEKYKLLITQEKLKELLYISKLIIIQICLFLPKSISHQLKKQSKLCGSVKLTKAKVGE